MGQPLLKVVLLADAGHVDVQRWSRALAQAGADVHILSFREGTPDMKQVYRLPAIPGIGKLQYLTAVPYVRQLIRKIAPDIVVAYYVTGYGIIGALCGFCPTVQSTAGTDILIQPADPLMRPIIRFNLRRADLVTGLAPHMGDAIRQLGISEDRIFVVPLGIPVEQFAGTRAAPPRDGEIPRLVVTRSLQARYNIDRLIRAVHDLRQQGIEAHLTIAGDGPQRGYLEALIKELALEQQVAILGFVPNDQLPQLLAWHNLYVTVIQSDGVSSSLIEAMAVGLMPIVPDHPANRNWIEDGHNGLLLANVEPATIASAISRAMSDVSLRQRAYQQNLSLARSRGDLHHNSELFVERLWQVINAKPLVVPGLVDQREHW